MLEKIIWSIYAYTTKIIPNSHPDTHFFLIFGFSLKKTCTDVTNVAYYKIVYIHNEFTSVSFEFTYLFILISERLKIHPLLQ